MTIEDDPFGNYFDDEYSVTPAITAFIHSQNDYDNAQDTSQSLIESSPTICSFNVNMNHPPDYTLHHLIDSVDSAATNTPNELIEIISRNTTERNSTPSKHFFRQHSKH